MSKKKHRTGVISTTWTQTQQQQALIDKVIKWIWGTTKP